MRRPPKPILRGTTFLSRNNSVRIKARPHPGPLAQYVFSAVPGSAGILAGGRRWPVDSPTGMPALPGTALNTYLPQGEGEAFAALSTTHWTVIHFATRRQGCRRSQDSDLAS